MFIFVLFSLSSNQPSGQPSPSLINEKITKWTFSFGQLQKYIFFWEAAGRSKELSEFCDIISVIYEKKTHPSTSRCRRRSFRDDGCFHQKAEFNCFFVFFWKWGKHHLHPCTVGRIPWQWVLSPTEGQSLISVFALINKAISLVR